ncbi:MAG: hypothetical protein ACMXYF_04075 [Candidatus Woesearchaeota archaeon]
MVLFRFHKKGIYDTVTLFLFIVVLLIVLLGMLGFGQLLLFIESSQITQERQSLDFAAKKNEFLSCYGANSRVDSTRLSNDCSVDFEYEFTVLPTQACDDISNPLLISQDFVPDSFLPQGVFTVPFINQTNSIVCAGRLVVQ